MPREQGVKQVAANRKAFHDYFVLDRYEAGIELAGTEVKSVRAGTLNLKDAYCTVKDGELFVRGMHIREILKLQQRVMLDGIAIIPLSVYLKNSRVKLEIGLCKGKKLYDKRESDAKRTAQRDMDRNLKNY